MPNLRRAVVALALCGFLCGCSSPQTPISDPRVYQMGEPVKTGPLVYSVLDTEWFDQLGDPAAPRLPHDHFLAVRFSVTNAGSVTSGIPPLTVIGSQRATYTELNEANALPEWIGYIRSVKPAETLHGRILFDVPPGDYRLRVADDAEPENQSSATIQMPLELIRP
ncbi:MAG TPA: DUF4352 domain-containing protein [Bryobacteraceae bacterium]|nr:DUF4352 domain-containing protein [Bryobacteraceae bacterium]